MAHEIASIVRCKVNTLGTICGKSFTAPAALIIQPGQQTNGRVPQFMASLAEHIITGHPRLNKHLEARALEFMGMLRLQNFILSNDPELTRQRDYLRWSVHQATLNAQFSDERIEEFCEMIAERCAEIMTRPDIDPAERVPMIKGLLGDVLLGMRDQLQEPGKHQTPAILEVPEGSIPALETPK